MVFLAPILTQPLMQGLHSNDSRILDSVLNRADVTLIDNTFKRLPVWAVLLCPGHQLELESFQK